MVQIKQWTSFRQEEVSCQQGISSRMGGRHTSLVVQRRSNQVAKQGTQVPLATGPPSSPTAEKMTQDATETRHSQTSKNRADGDASPSASGRHQSGAAVGSGSSEERGRQRQGIPAFPSPAVAKEAAPSAETSP